MMAWLYFVTCAFDFILAPVFIAILSHDTSKMLAWDPLTLKAGALFHVSMLAIVGVTSWGRSQERLKTIEYHIETMKTLSPSTPAATEDSEETR